jgi:hypothetical protein
MDRKEFIQSYMGVFLASYAALNYDNNCQRGWTNHEQPVEDAECLAQEAWEQLEKAGLTK